MKKLTLLTIALLAIAFGNAQNVGIGTTTPTEGKLQVLSTDSAALLIQNTATPNLTKTGLFFKSDNNYSGNISTIKTNNLTYRMGLFTYGGSTASTLKERVSILDDGNVGIGTINPTAKLEVAGSLKISNGTEGINKVLTSDAIGNATWTSIGSLAGYKKCKQILATGAGTFTIPADVTEVMVEAWGAGSGAVRTSTTTSIVIQARFFGGTSGGYASTTQTVVPGSIISYNVGLGSNDNVDGSPILDGGSTTVTFPLGNIIALGGKGFTGSLGVAGQPQSGTSTLTNFYTLYGNPGGFPTFRGEQTSSTDFWKICNYGDGGKPVGMINPSYQRGSVYYFLNGAFLYYTIENSSIDNYPS